MKKIKILMTAAVLALSFTSCEDAIDIRQPGLLDADAAIQDVADLESALTLAYLSLDTTSEIHFSAVFTDEIRIAFSTGGQGRSLYQHNLNAGSTMPTVLWTRSYVGINRANRIIEAAELIETSSAAEEEAKNNVVGQAHAIRGYFHLRLLAHMSADLSDDSSLGVPLVDFVPGTDFTPLRATTGEVFDLIYSDADVAIDLISDESSTIFLSQDAAKAMKARAAAYRGDYDTAAPLASELLDEYGLADVEEYDGVFDDTSNAEIIFKLERTINDPYDGQGATGSSAAGGWAGANFAFSGPGLGGGPYYEVATNLWESYVDGDDRRDNIGIEFPNVPEAGRDVYIVNKYRGSEGQPLMNDLKVFRSSEMLLILAEAAADDNDLDEVEDLIERLLDARIDDIDPSDPNVDLYVADEDYSSQQEAYRAILNQRRLEFAFEGHRYLDLRRLGPLAGVTIDRAEMDCEPFGACDLAITDFRFTLPLPLQEFNGNPGLRAQQNAGY